MKKNVKRVLLMCAIVLGATTLNAQEVDAYDIIEYDTNRKPLLLKLFDYGIRSFMKPSTYLNNEKGYDENSNNMPIIITGSNNDSFEIDDLASQGWKRLNVN